MTIDIQPKEIVFIGHQVRLDCKLPQSRLILWSSRTHGGRLTNPLTIRMTMNDTNTRLFCHAKDINGQWHRKAVRIQRYSQNEVILQVTNITVQQAKVAKKPRKSRFIKVKNIS